MDASSVLSLAEICAPLVAAATTQAIVQVESGFNPYAIGVVGGVLARQPRGRTEAVLTAQRLAADGWNFSVGLAQINQSNFTRLGLSIETVFDPCINLRAMQSVLTECHSRGPRHRTSQHRLRDALSCYYSGNFSTGYRHGYVQRVRHAARPPP